MASINNSAAGYEYTPGDNSEAEKRDKARQAAAANGGTAPAGTSGGSGGVSWTVTGAASKPASSGGSGGGTGNGNASPGSTGYSASAAQKANMAEHGYNYTPGMDIKLSGDIAAGDPIFGSAGVDANGYFDPSTAFYKTLPNGWRVPNTFSNGSLQPGDPFYMDTTQGSAWSQESKSPGTGGVNTAADYGAIANAYATGDASGLTDAQKQALKTYSDGKSGKTASQTVPSQAAQAQAGGAMPQGWTEYAYDAEGKPFTLGTEAAYDFLYNSTAKTMTGANGITFTRNNDGTVTITEKSGRTSVWRPGGGASSYGSASGQAGAQSPGALQLSAYDAAYLAPEDQQAIAALKKAYENAKASGNTEAMESSNRQANAIRAKYGYTGGGDGATFRLLDQDQKTLGNIDLGNYESALQGMSYTPQAGGGNWANALSPSSPRENLTRYTGMADVLSPTQQQGYDLGTFESALGGVSQVPAALQAGNGNLADYTSALTGMQYSGPSRAAEQALGNIDLGTYASALTGMQYTPMGNIQEEALARTVLPQYQAAYAGLTAPELASREFAMMQNAVLPGYEAQIDAVNQVYNNQQAAALAGLQSAYENSRAEMERGMSKIASAYQQQKNTTAAESEIARRNYQEQAAASGLNAGNRGQAALAFSNQLQGNLNQLNTAQANAISDAQFELDRLYSDYQNQISQAIAQNNYERAAALLQEYQTAQKSKVDTALNQANLNLQTADFNRQVRNDQTSAMQQDFQNQLSLAQGRQSDQQAAADLAYRQAGLDLQTAQYNREGRQLQRDAAQQDWQNQLTLAQLQDAAQQDAWNRAYQQAGLNLDIAQYNREGRNLDWQAAQQEYANYLNFLQMQDAANQSAFDRSLQTAAFNREGQQMAYDTAMRSYEAELARAQAQDAANQAAWERAYQQAGLDLNVAQFNQDALKDYYQALQQDFTNQMAVNQEARDAQALAYDQAYRKAQMDMDSWSLNQDVQQRNFQNQLALAQAQDSAAMDAWNRSLQQAGLDLDVYDRNRQAELDQLARQQQLFDNQRALQDERYQQNVFDYQMQQDALDRQEKAAQTAWDQQQQQWENELALTELGAKYNDFNRLAAYGYSPEQIQQMYRFAQLEALGYTW